MHMIANPTQPPKARAPLPCLYCGAPIGTGQCPPLCLHQTIRRSTLIAFRRRQARRYGERWLSLYCVLIGAVALRVRGG